MITIKTRIIIIFSILFGLMAGVIFIMSLLYKSSQEVTKTEQIHFELYQLSDQLRQTSDDLTRMARTYVVTADPRFKQYFDDILSIRNGTTKRPANYNQIYWDYVTAEHGYPDNWGPPVSLLQLMEEKGLTDEELDLIKQAKNNSDTLAKLEIEAFNAMEGLFIDNNGNFTIKGEPDPTLARRLLHGKNYHKAKADIMQPIDEFMQLVDKRTQSEVIAARQKEMRYLVFVVCLSILTILILIISFFNIKQSVSTPLQSLIDFVENVYPQNTHIAIKQSPSDEISTLRKSFESMLDRISKDRTNEMEAVNEKLLQEISERKHTEIELTLSNEKYQAIFDDSVAAIYTFDADKNFTNVNQAGLDLLGYTRDELLNMNWDDIEADNTKTDDPQVENNILSHEHQIRRKDNEILTVLDSSRLFTNDSGQITGMQSTLIDISEKYELAKKLSYQASHDSLTGMINRFEFERRATQVIENCQVDNSKHILCYLDLDRFKVINDSCGHEAGDELLRQIGRLFKSIVRKRDTLARFGGDEFTLLLEDCTITQALRISNKLLKAVQNFQFLWNNDTFMLGVSIGVTDITSQTSDITEVLKRADVACYKAKDLGRNQIHVYQHDDEAAVSSSGDMQWMPKMYRALEEDLFCLYGQMIKPLNGDDSKHYEVLIRMEDEGEIIAPGAFLPIAERYNLMHQLDIWVIKNVLKLLAHNQSFLEEVNFLSINLSGQSLAKEDVLNTILELLISSAISGEKICFEITETTAISNLDIALKFITTLKDKGCLFALDDFGSGFSSLGYLKNLPVDYLKIDGIFVKSIVNNPIEYAMVKSINEIGQVMGMKSIAEFVEDDQTIALLKEIGIDYGQGYGIEKPKPLSEIITLSKQSTHAA